MLFLGIDAGTTSLKAGLFDEKGTARSVAAEECRLITPTADAVEFDAEDYWRICQRVVRRALANVNRHQVRAIAVCSQGETIIPVDIHGNPLRRALVWLDNRSFREAKTIASQFDVERVYATTGNPTVVPMWTACKLLWLKENEPEILKRTHKFLLVQSFILYRLTGCFVTDGAAASTTMLLDIRRNAWWDEMLEFLGIQAENLAELRTPGTIVGHLTPEAAEALGLDPDLLVTPAGMDQAAGAVGAGNLHAGVISETTGTALAILATVPSSDLDPTRRLPVCVHAAAGRYLFEPICMTGGMTLKWFRDNLGVGGAERTRIGDDESYGRLVAEAAQVEPGCEGLTMLPHLMGAFSPEYNPNARGAFYGFSLRHTRGHFVRAILEAIAFVLKRNLDLMNQLGVQALEVRSTGGGAKSATWLQMKADVLGLDVVTLEEQETALLGGAMLGAVAAGTFRDLDEAAAQMVHVHGRLKPNPAYRAAYDEAFAKYCDLYDHVADLSGKTWLIKIHSPA